jgi:MoaA/NifB/PqqE/SkfB family radical SAM enzyme
MLTDVHILLTYQCTFECDHCFLFSGPFSQGTMTLPQIQRILDESVKIGSVEWIYFEGGEPFLFYPLLLEGIKRARDMGFRVGIVTNGYWAISEEDAELWLKPIHERGLDYLSISDDSFHYKEENNSARRALIAAKRLGMTTTPICIKKPFIEELPGEGQQKGASVIGGGVMFKGRAVEKLTAGLPRKPWQDLAQCPFEELRTPMRVHIDPYGHIHICQGISLGNMFITPLSELINEYKSDLHPICAPLSKGGPAALARHYDVKHQEGYIDECHFCYLVRRALTDRFPKYLAPRQVYGFGVDE